jgi:hypothetical protein
MMAIAPEQLPALKTELTTDPTGIGYAQMDATQREAAINLPRAGISVNRGTIPPQELVEAVVRTEMPTNAADRDWLLMVVAGERVRVDTGSAVRSGLLAIFGAATTTRANLTGASSKTPASRAEQLFGINAVVSYNDIRQAMEA